MAVTLVEANPVYTAPPHSNAVLGGLTDIRSQQFGYDSVKALGIDVALSPLIGSRPRQSDRDAR